MQGLIAHFQQQFKNCLKIDLQTWIYLPLGEYLKFEIRLNLFFLYLNPETKLPINYKSV